MKKGSNFKTRKFFNYLESFLYCLYSKPVYVRENGKADMGIEEYQNGGKCLDYDVSLSKYFSEHKKFYAAFDISKKGWIQ